MVISLFSFSSVTKLELKEKSEVKPENLQKKQNPVIPLVELLLSFALKKWNNNQLNCDVRVSNRDAVKWDAEGGAAPARGCSCRATLIYRVFVLFRFPFKNVRFLPADSCSNIYAQNVNRNKATRTERIQKRSEADRGSLHESVK